MNAFRSSTPRTLPPAESDLVAEGGNVLVSDDAPVRARLLGHPPAGGAGNRIARLLQPTGGRTTRGTA
jgi:hypothetical protein